ncbi:MAG: hypothetical protein ACTHOD_19050 [Motilibacteraceae bacterium]
MPPEPDAVLSAARAARLTVPRSARLVAWGNAVLAGAVSLDAAADAVVGEDVRHRVAGLPGEDTEVSLPVALGRLRAMGVRALHLALPVPGDPFGLAGPPAFTEAAVQAGEAVVVTGAATGVPAWGLLPAVTALGSSGWAVLWSVTEVAPPRTGDTPSLAEAERALAVAVREATEELSALDVSRADPAALLVLRAVSEDGAGEDTLPPGTPGRAERVLAQARRTLVLADLARRGDGGALTAAAADTRARALDPLERAARRAMAAACQVLLEPPRD